MSTKATAADAATLVPLLATAFQDDPVAVWIFRDADRRREILPRFFQVFYGLSLDCDGVYTTADRDGVILTVSPDAPDPQLGDIPGEYAAALETVIGMLYGSRPEKPHQYISFGAVLPGRQRSGLASQMLGEIVHDFDEKGMPIYLEASSPGGQATARAKGFTPVGSEVRIPDGPALQPMWRDPNV